MAPASSDGELGLPTTSDVPEIGYAIGKKVGNAVIRNRIRRRLRPIVASEAPTLPLGIYLIGVKNDRAARVSYDELRDDLKSVLAASVARQQQPADHQSAKH